MELEFSWQIFEKNSLHENPSIGSRVVPCGWMDRRTDVTKLIIAFRNFANAPKRTQKAFNVSAVPICTWLNTINHVTDHSRHLMYVECSWPGTFPVICCQTILWIPCKRGSTNYAQEWGVFISHYWQLFLAGSHSDTACVLEFHCGPAEKLWTYIRGKLEYWDTVCCVCTEYSVKNPLNLPLIYSNFVF